MRSPRRQWVKRGVGTKSVARKVDISGLKRIAFIETLGCGIPSGNTIKCTYKMLKNYRVNLFKQTRAIFYRLISNVDTEKARAVENPPVVIEWSSYPVYSIQLLLMTWRSNADSKVRGANMGPIWGRQDPCGPHVGPMNLAIWEGIKATVSG